MKLTKQEVNLLAIEKFFNSFKEEFEGVSFIAISASVYENYCKEFKPSENIYPLSIRVERVRNTGISDWLKYSWELGASDDEIAIYSNTGSRYGFHEIKDYIEKELPEAFKGKSFYKYGMKVNSDNIDELVAPIKIKLNAINLGQELLQKTDRTNKKLKI